MTAGNDSLSEDPLPTRYSPRRLRCFLRPCQQRLALLLGLEPPDRPNVQFARGMDRNGLFAEQMATYKGFNRSDARLNSRGISRETLQLGILVGRR